MPRIITAVILSALCFTVFADARIIAVEGRGKIEAVPDLIRINMTVYKHAADDIATAKAYVDDMSSKTAAALIANGVQAQDIFSSSMTIQTAERYDENDNPVPAGHIASRDIDTIVRDVDTYSTVVQALVDVGISDISSVEPALSNYAALQRQALARAAQQAREKAEFLANYLGATLGAVHQIGKQRTYRQFVDLDEVIVTAGARSDADVKTVQYEFQPGTVEVEASVYVEFEIE